MFNIMGDSWVCVDHNEWGFILENDNDPSPPNRGCWYRDIYVTWVEYDEWRANIQYYNGKYLSE